MPDSVPEVVVDEVVVPEVASTEVSPEVVPATVEPTPVVPDVVPEVVEPKEDVPEFNGVVDIEFNGQAAQVTLPEDMVSKFSEVGIDGSALVSDLYSGDSFGLSKENHDKLSELYGASMVDSYINALEAQNQLAANSMKAEEEAFTAMQDKVDSETMDQIGGEDNWVLLNDFASKSLSDEQISELNDVMDNGSRYAQKLALDDLKSKYEASEGEMSFSVVEGESQTADTSGVLSASDYLHLFKTGEYSKSPEKYDAMRQRSMDKGL